VVRNHHNTEVVEIAPGTLLAARVAEYKPASQQPLEQVRDEVVKQFTQSEAAKLARKQGETQLEALKKGEGDAARFGPAKLVSRENPGGLRPEAADPVFRANVAKLPAFVGVETPDGYGIYRITKLVPVAADEVKQKAMQTELARLAGAQEFRAFISGLRGSSSVTINRAQLDKKPDQ